VSETHASLGTTYALTVLVPQLVPPSPNATRREHWTARSRRVKREKEAVRLVLSQYTPPTTVQLHVALVRCSPRLLDIDNAWGSMKGPIDATADWLGLDDNDPRIEWKVEQQKVKREDVGVLIRVEARR
jgi:hypothetical protein